MASENVNGVHKLFVLLHLLGDVPTANLICGNYLYRGVVIRAVGFRLERLGKVLYPVGVYRPFVAHGTDIIELNAVGFVCGVKGFLVPLISCRVYIFGICDPQRLAPVKHIQRKIGVDFLRVRCELIACPAGNIRLFILGALYVRLRAG